MLVKEATVIYPCSSICTSSEHLQNIHLEQAQPGGLEEAVAPLVQLWPVAASVEAGP